MDVVFDNGIDTDEKVNIVNEQDEVEITFEDLDDSNAIALTLDSNGQYQFHGDGGAVTYRVVQVASPDDVQHIVSGLSSSQAILQGLQTANSDEVSSSSDSPRFTYVPSTSIQQSMTLESSTSQTNTTKNPIYVMVAPSEVLQTSNQRTAIPRGMMLKTEPATGRSPRDDRRKMTHKEVERRRRDKINSWIMQLAKLLPECSCEQPKLPDSKGGILSKACEYITELQTENQELEENLKDYDQIKNDLQLLHQQYEELKQENFILRSHLQRNGITDFRSKPENL